VVLKLPTYTTRAGSTLTEVNSGALRLADAAQCRSGGMNP
jgi:hypothetical protein